jgi:hypothetical protein
LLQPFPQARRDTYRITAAERETWPVSERVTGQVLHYRQMFALLTRRGWKPQYLLMHREYPIDQGGAHRDLGGGWRATFTYEAVEIEDFGCPPLYCTAGAVRFEKSGQPSATVPSLVFSEAMRDIGLLVGAAGVGQDIDEFEGAGGRVETLGDALAQLRGFGESTRIRRDALAQLLPRTSIANRCRIDGDWLEVQGQLATYRINIRRGSVSIEPGNWHLCIVPDWKDPDRVFLPFEGEGGLLSEIVSKAFLLADDAHITDPEIVAQLERSTSP